MLVVAEDSLTVTIHRRFLLIQESRARDGFRFPNTSIEIGGGSLQMRMPDVKKVQVWEVVINMRC